MWRTAIALIVATTNLAPGAEPPAVCLRGHDPVALVAGRREAGQDSLTAVQGRYQYLFATVANRAAFLKEPERFAVQYSGACAKMGPLSGRGSPDRFAMHDGRIYLFASDSCLAAFEKSPASYVERDEAPPVGTEQSRTRGQELLALALRGFGGEVQVDAVQSLTLQTKRPYQDGGQTREHTIGWIAAFPDRFARTDAWHGASTAMVETKDGGWYRGTKETEAYDELERKFLRREFRRIPLVLLKARGESGFQAVASGRGKVGEREVELLTIHLEGVNHTLGIDPQSGRVLSVGYRGRLTSPIVQVVKTYDDFRDVQGLSLPFAAAAGEDGQAPVAKSAFARVAVNEPLAAELFRFPLPLGEG